MGLLSPAEAQAVQDDLIARRVVLRYLLSDVVPRSPLADAVVRFLRERDCFPGAPPGVIPAIESWDWSDHSACEPWRAWREALRSSADAQVEQANG